MIFGKWDERSGSRSEIRPAMTPVSSAVPEAKKPVVVVADQPVE
jgi:hypothetical protein